MENSLISGQRSDVHEPLDLANQWSRSDWQITNRQRKLEAIGTDHMENVTTIGTINEDHQSSAQIEDLI